MAIRHVFDSLPTHPFAHGYVKGKSIGTNASVHRRSKYISRLDFENFFPSLTSGTWICFSGTWHLIAGAVLSEEDIQLIISLTCRFGRLTIGAPCSPTISNKLVYSFDTRIAEIAAQYNANYTRYADDLYFSSSQPKVLYEVCKKTEKYRETTSPRLVINKKKTFHARERDEWLLPVCG